MCLRWCRLSFSPSNSRTLARTHSVSLALSPRPHSPPFCRSPPASSPPRRDRSRRRVFFTGLRIRAINNRPSARWHSRRTEKRKNGKRKKRIKTRLCTHTCTKHTPTYTRVYRIISRKKKKKNGQRFFGNRSNGPTRIPENRWETKHKPFSRNILRDFRWGDSMRLCLQSE